MKWTRLSILASASVGCQSDVPELTIADLVPAEPVLPVAIPLWGGTLESVPELSLVVAADPAGDRLVVQHTVDGVADPALLIDLGPATGPFRLLAEGSSAWVTLRTTGELARADLLTGEVLGRTPVCPEPRGVERSPTGTIVVACASGELVELTDDPRVIRSVTLETDLRDVVAADGFLFVSRFRPADVLVLDPITLQAVYTHRLHRFDGLLPTVAWRMRASHDGGVRVVVQAANDDEPIRPPTGGAPSYGGGGGCGGPHSVAIAEVQAVGGPTYSIGIGEISLPLDFVVTRTDQLYIVNGGRGPESPGTGGVVSFTLGVLDGDGSCVTALRGTPMPDDVQPTALALEDGETDAMLVIQTAAAPSLFRIPGGDASLTTVGETTWSDPTDRDGSFGAIRTFHRATAGGLSCASCHPEGLDDGRVWTLEAGVAGVEVPGPRRTLPLAGRLSLRAPYHWLGEHPDPDDVMESTFFGRMAGTHIRPGGTDALFDWLDRLPIPRVSLSAEQAPQVDRGAQLFIDSGCAECHLPGAFTDGLVHVVRSDLPAKTPSLLGVGARTSLFHDGCASSLLERFDGLTTCTGGDAHGAVSSLSEADVDALVAFLLTL